MTDSHNQAAPVEFSRPFVVEGLEKPKTLSLEADEGERAALARRFGLDGLDSLRADITVAPKRGGRDIRVEGHFTARVRQTCGVTLVPLESPLEGPVDGFYSIDIKDEFLGLEEEGDGNLSGPDPLPDDGLDLGELTAEALGLEIDPFPRAPGVAFEPPSASNATEDGASGRPNPFEKLKKLKENRGSNPEKGG